MYNEEIMSWGHLIREIYGFEIMKIEMRLRVTEVRRRARACIMNGAKSLRKYQCHLKCPELIYMQAERRNPSI